MGIADKEYFEKREYDEEFYKLWRKLQKEKLVKHSLEEIENSDLFKYSPFKEFENEYGTSGDLSLSPLDHERTSPDNKYQFSYSNI